MPPRSWDRTSLSARQGHPCRRQEPDGFTCRHCGTFVSTATALSGVLNRNHCPYCLWSRHLDWRAPGDRLSACKSPMRPIGLTLKPGRDKYGSGRGELMLIHVCLECGRLSINRLAADDDPQSVCAVFEDSLRLEAIMRQRMEAEGILALDAGGASLVRTRLYGREPALQAA